MVEGSVAYVAPGRGGSVWIGDRELVTFKQTGADTGGLFALLEVTGLPGSGPPPHIHRRVDELYRVLEGELEVFDGDRRSEEHTSELQSRQYLVCRLLLEKKK